jgi:hypothetical protein
MAIRNQHLPGHGFRFYSGDVSILLHMLSVTKKNMRFTKQQLNNFFRITNHALAQFGTYPAEEASYSQILTADRFPPPCRFDFYKYVTPATLQFVLNDSFQFGSVQFYRDIENPNSKDAMEGASSLSISTRDRMVCASLSSGYNFGIFCGTQNTATKELMKGQFGQHLIKIIDLRAFAEDACKALGASRYYINHVQYNDLKLFRAKTLKRFHFSEPSGNFDLEAIDDAMFKYLYQSTFHSSLYIKPTRFSQEAELRLVFEIDKDIPNVLRAIDAGLSKHIEVVESC